MIRAAITCFAIMCCLPAWSQDTDWNKNWPQWRGPEATGVAPYGDPPIEWGEDKNVKWKREIPGIGHSTPIIWKDKIFILSAIKTDKKVLAEEKLKTEERSTGQRVFPNTRKPHNIHEYVLFIIDRQNGKILKKVVACEAAPHEGIHNDNSWASHSPVTDGERVYAFFGSRGLYCFDLEGNLLWDEDLGDMSARRGYGEGSSPVVYGDTIVVNWDHEGDSFIIALNKKTGEKRWKVPRNETTTWTTPLVVEHDGKPQVIVGAINRIRSYDLATGKVIWECGGLTGNVTPCPVHLDGIVYVMSGYSGYALLAIKLAGASGDITDTEAVVWKHNRDTSYVPSPLLYEDRLYFIRSNSGAISCLDAKTGEVQYARQRLDGFRGVYSSPVGANGCIYLVGRNGVMQVIKAGPKYELLAANQLEDDFSASPVIKGKELFLRGHKYLYCITEE